MYAKITKTVAIALVVASASLTLASTGNAGPQSSRFDQEKAWMDHASQTVDGGGN
jgi:hypothetical protein